MAVKRRNTRPSRPSPSGWSLCPDVELAVKLCGLGDSDFFGLVAESLEIAPGSLDPPTLLFGITLASRH